MNINSIIKPKEATIIGISPEYGSSIPNYVEYSEDNRVLRPAEASTLIDYAEREGFIDEPLEQYSWCDISLVKLDKFQNDFRWIYFLIVQRFAWANQLYKFNLSGITENISILKFTPEKSHKQRIIKQDFTANPNRKLIGYINLSDGLQYKGGDLFLINNGENKVVERGIGDMVIYPAWTPNYISPIEKGSKYVILATASGTPFA